MNRKLMTLRHGGQRPPVIWAGARRHHPFKPQAPNLKPYLWVGGGSGSAASQLRRDKSSIQHPASSIERVGRRAAYRSSSRIASAMRSAWPSISKALSPSTMTRARGSVPE